MVVETKTIVFETTDGKVVKMGSNDKLTASEIKSLIEHLKFWEQIYEKYKIDKTC